MDRFIEEPAKFRLHVQSSDDFVRSLVADAYFIQHRRAQFDRKSSSRTNISSKIDPVDGSYVAKFQMRLLLGRAHLCCKRGLQLGLGDIDPIMADETEIARKLEQRGQPRRPIKGLEAEALELLSKDSHGALYDQVHGQFDDENSTFCRIFFVNKKPDENGLVKLRVIADARLCNAIMTAKGFDFSVFTLDALIQRIGNFSELQKLKTAFKSFEATSSF